MPVNRNIQGTKTTSKPRALNSLTKLAGKSSKAVAKKRSSKKPTSPPSISPRFSLYSSDSDSAGVSSLNHGLDRCAALLANILDEEDVVGVPSKISSTKKQRIQSRQPLKGKPMPRATHTTIKKKKHAQDVAKMPAGNSQSTIKSAVKSFGRQRTSEQNVKRTLEVVVPQATQFNNRLVSSTPDMGSPTSDNEPRQYANDSNVQSNKVPPNSSLHNVHHDPSLEALATQIQMLRSQAETNEKLSEPFDHIPVRDTSVGIQSGDRIQPSALQHEKIGHSAPKQMLQNLTDHLKDRNIMHQVLTTERNQDTFQSQAWQHPTQHEPHLNANPVQNKATSENSGQTTVLPHRCSGYQQHSHTQFNMEPPESRNTSFIPEYHQLPAQNIGTSQTGEILKQLNEIQNVMSPVIPHSVSESMLNNHATNQQMPSNNQSKLKHMANQSIAVKTATPSPKDDRTMQHAIPEHYKRPTMLNMSMDNPIETMCIGTQTYSPPAHKGVQTSIVSSPISSEIQSSIDGDAVPTKDVIKNALQDTPHPQPRIQGKKTASWEQKRKLKYLIGELRAAIGDIGDDKDVQRLLSEIEECLDTLQFLPPDLQTEIGLALQPLRSENSRLRRRLRIANQQIRRLEKGENKENVEPPIDVEGRDGYQGQLLREIMAIMKSLNAKLQKDLREEENKVQRLVESSAEYKSTIDNMKHKHCDMMNVLQQKDAHQLDSRQEWMEEKSALNNQLEEMQSQLKDLQLRMDATNTENKILQQKLQQRDAKMAPLNQDSKYLHAKPQVFTNEKDCNSESDDDVTPKASPQHSPVKIQDCPYPQTRHFIDFQNQDTETLDRTNRFEVTSETSDTNYPAQSFPKRVTFAEHVSPNHRRCSTDMAGAHLRNGHHGNCDRMLHHSERLGMSKKPSSYIDDATENNRSLDPLHMLHSERADKEFSMRKFLEHSKPLSSDEDVPDSHHSDTDFNKPKLSNIYYHQPFHNEPIHVDEQRTQLYNSIPQIRQVDHNQRYGDNVFISKGSAQIRQVDHNQRYGDNVFISKGSAQDAIFQGSVLDGSVSGIDSTSTQSSVTSQYEAQFQLGLANLDTEIAKLQNSLRSMSTGKPIQTLHR